MPQQFGRFWLHEKIGHGGMAEIFRATVGPEPDEAAFDFAFKRLHGHLMSDPEQVSMFLTEADVAKILRHPNLVRVFESGSVGERPYVAMEYVAGMDLERFMNLLRIRGWVFPEDLAVYVAMEVLRGLDYIHRAQTPAGDFMAMVHRDITPSNIYLLFNGEVKFGDFGIAHVNFLEDRAGGPIKGKVAYIPPEILQGVPVSQQDDLWALAACVYNMLSGSGLYANLDEDAVLGGADFPPIRPINRVVHTISPKLAAILKRALHAKAHKRHGQAAELYRDLKGFLAVQGIQVDRSALARFLVSATGSEGGVLGAQPSAQVDDFFDSPTQFHSPMGISLTQRIEMVPEVVARSPWRFLGAAALAAAGFALYWGLR